MAKLRKRSKSHADSRTSSASSGHTTASTGPPVLPMIAEHSAFTTQQLRNATIHERRDTDGPGREVLPGRERAYASAAESTEAQSPSAPLLTAEPHAVPKTHRRPSPLRVSQEASTESELVVAGPATLAPESRRGGCSPSCQKCGRPRKPVSPDTALDVDEITRAPPANWPLPAPATGIAPPPTAPRPAAPPPEPAPEPAPEPTAAPSNDQRRKRRRYFSLPIKSKPSFKGPAELSSGKGKPVEPPANTAPGEQRSRPVSAPSPTQSSFKGPLALQRPNPQPQPAAHVRFAADEHLGHFAALIRAPETTSSRRLDALRSLTPGPAPHHRSQHDGNAVSEPPPSRPQQAPRAHPPSLAPAQPAGRANSAILYEWPLITTLVNQPTANPTTGCPPLASATNRSSLSISKRPSRRTARPSSHQHIHAPTPTHHASTRLESLLQQSRKVSSTTDHASDSSRDSMSIQILDILQAFPGGELAATAKNQPDTKQLAERPSLLRLQTYPQATKMDTLPPCTDAPDEQKYPDPYSPSEYGSEDDDDDDDDNQPVTPPQSDFSLASYSIGDDRKPNLRPTSTATQASFSIGDDKHLPLQKPSSDLSLAPAPPPSGPSSPSDDDARLATAESPPSAPSTPLPLAQPLTLTLTPSPDSEGMIPVASRLSVVDLPEAVSSASASGDDEEIDSDWFSWGALPGSYGGAGMWSGESSLRLAGGSGSGSGAAELGGSF